MSDAKLNPSEEAEEVSSDSEVLEWHGPVLEKTEDYMSIPWLIRERVRKSPDQPIIARKVQMGSTWRNVSARILDEVNQVARGLIA